MVNAGIGYQTVSDENLSRFSDSIVSNRRFTGSILQLQTSAHRQHFMESVTESTLEAQSMADMDRIHPPGILSHQWPHQAAQKSFFRLFEFRIQPDLSS